MMLSTVISITLVFIFESEAQNSSLSIGSFKAVEFRPLTVSPKILRFIDPRIGGSTSNPGIKLRLSEKGLKYINQVAGNILNDEIRNAKLPDISKSFSRGKVEAKNMKITSFSAPAYKYRLISPNRLEWTLQNGAISISGKWKGKYKRIITIRGSGSFSAKAKNVKVTLSASMGKNSQGKPRLESVQCSASMSLSIKIKGGLVGWVLNKFNGKIEGKLRPALQDAICKMGKKFVSQEVNDKLNTLPTQSTLEDNFRIDYRLIANPKVGSNYVETSHKGEIRHKSASSTPFKPLVLKQSNSNSRMLYLWASDYILNSLLHHAHQRNITRFVVNENSLPHLKNFLRPSCPVFQICLGTLFPEIQDKYPNAKGEIVAKTLTDPIAVMRENNATVSGTGSVEVFLKSGRRIRLLKATIYAAVDLNARLKDTLTNEPKVYAQAKIRSLKVTKVESDFTQQEDMQMYVDFTKPMLEDQMNQFLGKGLPVLVTKGVRLRNLELRFKQRTLEMAADLSYAG